MKKVNKNKKDMVDQLKSKADEKNITVKNKMQEKFFDFKQRVNNI
jgi:hypothetical protein